MTGDCIWVEGCQIEAAFLVKIKCVKVVVGGDQPQAPAAGTLGSLAHCGNQAAADANPLQQAVDGHQLALLTLDMVRSQPNRLRSLPGDKPGQLVYLIHHCRVKQTGWSPTAGGQARQPRVCRLA